MTAVIRTEGLTKRYGRLTVVDGVGLAVPAGEVFGFLGPNGSGKTTTIRMLLGLVTPTAGHAELLGRPMPGGGPQAPAAAARARRAHQRSGPAGHPGDGHAAGGAGPRGHDGVPVQPPAVRGRDDLHGGGDDVARPPRRPRLDRAAPRAHRP